MTLEEDDQVLGGGHGEPYLQAALSYLVRDVVGQVMVFSEGNTGMVMVLEHYIDTEYYNTFPSYEIHF